MNVATTVVIGAGHNGLAMSRRLAARSIDHVVLERDEVGSSWRHRRWDSLRLLTPGWMTRLPGREPEGGGADDYLAASEVADLVARYARDNQAPVQTGTTTTSVRPQGDGFVVETDRGPWQARSVVMAGGATRASLPDLARHLPAGPTSLSALDYRHPEQLPPGGVLVVGASASGAQIAHELQASGRPVTLAVGEHVRLPRRRHGRDIFFWLDALGVLDQRWDRLEDLQRVRRLPSPQLSGSGRQLDLATLTSAGTRVVGRVVGLRGTRLQLSGDLSHTVALADLKMGRLLDAVDALTGAADERPDPVRLPPPPLELDLRSGEIRSVVWATGNRPDLSWLDVPVRDRRGRLRHDGGVVAWPGLYVLGLPAMRTRRSSYIDGCRADTRDLARHLSAHLAGRRGRRTQDGEPLPMSGVRLPA